MPLVDRRWRRIVRIVFCAWFLVTGVVAGHAAAETYREIWRTDEYPMDILLQVAPIRVGPGVDHLVVLGRNYETREVLLHLLAWNGQALEPHWMSDNLFEWASHVTMAVGDFRGRGEQEVLVATNATAQLFVHRGSGLERVWRGPNPQGVALDAIGVPAGDAGPTRLGLTRIQRVENGLPVKEIRWFEWLDGRWRRRGPGAVLGPVRSMAALPIRSQLPLLVVERGEGTAEGVVDVWRSGAATLERLTSQGLRPAAIFALDARAALGGDARGWLAVGDNHGRVGLYHWGEGGSFQPFGEPIPVGWVLTDLALANVTGGRLPDIAVLGYPRRIHLIALSSD